ELVSRTQITCRNMRRQKIRGAIEVALGHAERLQYVFIDVNFIVISAEPLDNLAKKDIAQVRIAPPRARPERHMRVRQHRRHLRPVRWLKWLPVAVRSVITVPWPRRISKARTVRKQVANRNRIDRSEFVMHLPQLRHIAHSRIIQRELASIAKLQDRDRRHRLGNRRPVIGGFCVYTLVSAVMHHAEEELLRRSLPVNNGNAAAYNPVLREHAVKPLLKRFALRQPNRR